MRAFPDKLSKHDSNDKSKRDERIKKLAAEGVSYRELADRFGLTRAHISRIVSGKA